MKSVVFRTSGIIDLRAITVFGCNAKPSTSSPIGYFGTGLKYALAILAREGCIVKICRGLEILELKCVPSSFRNTTLSSIWLGQQELPFTTELGKNWELWQALRELESNTRDEGGSSFIDDSDSVEPEEGATKIVVSSEEFLEEYENLSTIFIDRSLENISEDFSVEIFSAPSRFLYYKGIRVYEYDRPANYTYNINCHMELTENRTIAYWHVAERIISRAIAKFSKKELIEPLLVQEKIMESSLDFDDSYNCVEPSEQFVQVARETAPERSSARNFVIRLERESVELEEKPSAEEILADLVYSILETLCVEYIEEPAGINAGYGFRDGAHQAVTSLIQDFLDKQNGS